jgi:hypothetical protein
MRLLRSHALIHATPDGIARPQHYYGDMNQRKVGGVGFRPEIFVVEINRCRIFLEQR